MRQRSAGPRRAAHGVRLALVAVLLLPVPATARDRPRISEAEAAIAAVKAYPGKPNKVEFERKRGRWLYVVEVILPDRTDIDVLIDPDSAEVVGIE